MFSFNNNDYNLMNPKITVLSSLPTKVVLINDPNQNVIRVSLFIIVLAIHVSLASYLFSIDKKIIEPIKPTIVEVALLAAPKPKVIEPPTPEPIKPQPVKPQPQPQPPKPKVAPPKIKPLPKPKPVLPKKLLLKEKATEPDITLPQSAPVASEPKVEPISAPVSKAVQEVHKAPSNAVAVAKADERVTCVSCPHPSYPAIAKRRIWQGSVKLKLQLSSDGSVEQVTLLDSSGHDALDDAALEGAKHWRFAASSTGITRVATQIINFTLDN